jgi:integrase
VSEKPIIDLRRRMLEDMAVRKFGDKTRHDYIRHVETFTAFLGRSPDTATADDVRRYQVHLTESGAQPPKLNSSASALRFFFATTLDRPELAHRLARVHYPRKLPRVLSAQEVGRLLEAAPGPGLKYKAALSIAYGAGLRAGEVVMLRVSDIDSQRMLIRVELGKGGKDRHAMLSPQLLELLRAWWLQWLARLAVPRPRSAAADHGPAAQPSSGPGHVGHTAHPAPLLRHAPAGERHRRARDPGAARTRQARHHGALHPGRHQRPAWRYQPARSAAAAAEAGDGEAAGLRRRRLWHDPLWRSRISSATTGPPGVKPTAAT